MKKLIKKWLGITQLEQENSKLQKLICDSDIDLRNRIGKALWDVFSNKSDNDDWGYPYNWADYNNKFLEVVYRAVQTPTQHAVKQSVNSEEFIDKIIERIKNKQLS